MGTTSTCVICTVHLTQVWSEPLSGPLYTQKPHWANMSAEELAGRRAAKQTGFHIARVSLRIVNSKLKTPKKKLKETSLRLCESPDEDSGRHTWMLPPVMQVHYAIIHQAAPELADVQRLCYNGFESDSEVHP
jgi:hypothetical protein